jgi:TRAP-type uncharacterized transport system fused permease subunit
MDSAATSVAKDLPPVEGGSTRRTLPGAARWVLLAMFFVGIVVTTLQVFLVLQLFTNFYLYFLLALFLPPVFLVYGASKKATLVKVPWYDIALAVTTFAIFMYLMANALQITTQGPPRDGHSVRRCTTTSSAWSSCPSRSRQYGGSAATCSAVLRPFLPPTHCSPITCQGCSPARPFPGTPS